MVFPPKKFAWVVCWDVNHVKFCVCVKFAFKDFLPGIASCFVDGSNTVAISPWNSTAGLPLQSLLTDSNGVVILSHLSICRLTLGRCSGAISSVADAVMILSSATCALVASSGDAFLGLDPMCVDGKQFADAPESSAARTVVGCPWVVFVELKVTLLVALLADFTRNASLVFKMDTGDVVDVLDRDDTDDPAVVTAGDCF